MGLEFNSMNSDIYKRAKMPVGGSIFSERYFFPETILRPNPNFNRLKPPHYANTAGKTRKPWLTNVLSIRSPDFLLRISNELSHQRSHEKSDAQKIFDTRNSKHFFKLKLKKGILY